MNKQTPFALSMSKGLSSALKTFLKFLGNDSHVLAAIIILTAAAIGGSLALFHLRIGGWI